MKKTTTYKSGLSAHRARALIRVLNPENVLEENRKFEKNGIWSHDWVSFYYKPPLYILGYTHSTHPGPGQVWVHKWGENDSAPEKTWGQSTDEEGFKLLEDEELQQFKGEILDFVFKYLPQSFIERSINLGYIQPQVDMGKGIKIYNLTRWPVKLVRFERGRWVKIATIPPVKPILWGEYGVYVHEKEFDEIEIPAKAGVSPIDRADIDIGTITVKALYLSGIKNLPERKEGVFYIVPRDVARLVKRSDFLIPEFARDERDRIIGVKGFYVYSLDPKKDWGIRENE